MVGTIRPDPYSLPVHYKEKHQKNREAHPSNPSGKPHGAPTWHGSNVISHHRRLQRMVRVWNSSGENNRHRAPHARRVFKLESPIEWPLLAYVRPSAIRGSTCSPKGMVLVPIRSASPCCRQLSRLGRRWETIEERTGVEASDADGDAPLMVYLPNRLGVTPLVPLSLPLPHFSTLVDPMSASMGPYVNERQASEDDRLMDVEGGALCCARFKVGAA